MNFVKCCLRQILNNSDLLINSANVLHHIFFFCAKNIVSACPSAVHVYLISSGGRNIRSQVASRDALLPGVNRCAAATLEQRLNRFLAVQISFLKLFSPAEKLCKLGAQTFELICRFLTRARKQKISPALN